MEGSINSCMNQSAALHDQSFKGIRTIDDSPPPQEESGWTVYFDEFFSNNRQNSASYSSSSSGLETPSLVSDAASCAPWKFSNNGHVVVGGGSQPNNSKKLRLLNKKKKTRAGGVNLDEDALEDTASSPVNSPKVSSMKQYHHLMNPRKNDHHDDINIEYSTSDHQKKGSMLDDHHFTELQTDDQRNQLGFIGRENNDCTELKKKGLCLVPLSMLVNYLGSS